MAEERAKRALKDLGAEDAAAFSANFLTHRPGITPQESTLAYDQWTTYEQDLCSDRYRGPAIAASAVGLFFPTHRDSKLIIDVACGTGFVGEELKKLGFKRMHGLDPSSRMLELARQKTIYQKDYCCYLDHTRLPIDDDAYDCAVISGGMGEGHIPVAGLYQLARIVKPGGLVCIVMREEYLDDVAEYRGRLESTMAQMEADGVWQMAGRIIVPKYSFDNKGVVFSFIVC